MGANWKVELGEVDRRPPAARTEHGIPVYEIAPHRESKPPVESVDVEHPPVPAREDAKVAGTFGVDAPYEQRKRA